MTQRQKDVLKWFMTVIGPLAVLAVAGAFSDELTLRRRVSTLEVRADRTDSVTAEQGRRILGILCAQFPNSIECQRR